MNRRNQCVSGDCTLHLQAPEASTKYEDCLLVGSAMLTSKDSVNSTDSVEGPCTCTLGIS